jgi:hypothetical protein
MRRQAAAGRDDDAGEFELVRLRSLAFNSSAGTSLYSFPSPIIFRACENARSRYLVYILSALYPRPPGLR